MQEFPRNSKPHIDGGHDSNPCSSSAFLSPPSSPGGFGPLAPLRPTRLRARRAGLGLGGRVSIGAGPGRLWGDVLSTHCEETGGCDPPPCRLAEAHVGGPWTTRRASLPQGALLLHKYWAHCARQVSDLDDAFFATVNGILARYSPTFCRWADGAATVSGSDSWQRWGGRRL